MDKARLHLFSPAMQAVYDRAVEAAASDASILILGEDGVGRKTMAKRVHRLSARAPRPLEVVCLPGLPAALWADELFGRAEPALADGAEARAGAFERADKGTILLDEIGYAETDARHGILRTLETREVIRLGSNKHIPIDVRVIATAEHYRGANASSHAARLEEYVSWFDVILEIPALRERRSEIPDLARIFAADQSEHRPPPTIQPAAMALLEQHCWPSNVLSLRIAVQTAVLLSGGADITAEHLPIVQPGR